MSGLRRWMIAGVICAVAPMLSFASTAAFSAQDLPESILRVQKANTALIVCTQGEVAGLDDRISEATVIAKALAHVCGQEVLTVGALRYLSLTEGGDRAVVNEVLDEAARANNDLLLTVVLRHRAALINSP